MRSVTKTSPRNLTGIGTWLLPLVGVVALAWFLVRVIPKPSRAGYACQRLALQQALTFLLGPLLGFLGLEIWRERQRKLN